MCEFKQKFQCSVSVIPIVSTEKRYIDIIQKSMQKVIPYIEELTQVSYYPVTTYIVDEYIIKSQYSQLVENESDDLIFEDIKEVLKFLSWIAIGYHTKRFNSIGEDIDYMDFCNLAEDQLDKLKWMSEGMCFYLEKYCEGKDNINMDKLFIEEISKDADFVVNFFDDFEQILNIFWKITKSREFEDIRLDYEEGKVYPLIRVWEKYLSNKNFEIINKNIVKEGKWTNKLSDIIQVVVITLEMLKKMLYKFKITTNKYSTITKEMHTYGVYFHKREGSNPQFAKILMDNGFPECIEQFNTGKVLICIDSIMKRVDQVYEANHSIDKEWLIQNLITALLVHEHTHAANFEGVKHNHSQPLYNSHENNNNHIYSVVTEALAEWSELNYFRDDNIISEIILSHINSGEIKDWPYAGAALIENRFNELGVTNFQTIFDMSRMSCRNAYKILKI